MEPETASHAVGLFSSNRERRLWLWVLVVVVAIYSTLGLARTLADRLGENVITIGLYIVAFVAVLALIAAHGLTRRPTAPEIIVGVCVGIAYIMVLVRMTIPAERTHLFEYSALALLIYEALLERARNGRGVRFSGLLAIAATSCVGIMDEGLQAFIPSRVFDPRDILFNVLAAIMAVSGSGALAWARSRVGRRESVDQVSKNH